MSKPIHILLLSDIHGNYPALEAIAQNHPPHFFSAIFNSGDSTVYCPFPNETLDWLQKHNVHSIRGNTDDKIRKLLKGKNFKKPGKHEKRIMYSSTAEVLTEQNKKYLLRLKKKYECVLGKYSIGMFHGSPAKHEEFLFAETADKRFRELATHYPHDIIITGHSHSPYHKFINGTHFINPGSSGRMFDGNPEVSYAVLTIDNSIVVKHFRVLYKVNSVVEKIHQMNLPSIYCEMFKLGKKLN